MSHVSVTQLKLDSFAHGSTGQLSALVSTSFSTSHLVSHRRSSKIGNISPIDIHYRELSTIVARPIPLTSRYPLLRFRPASKAIYHHKLPRHQDPDHRHVGFTNRPAAGRSLDQTHCQRISAMVIIPPVEFNSPNLVCPTRITSINTNIPRRRIGRDGPRPQLGER